MGWRSQGPQMQKNWHRSEATSMITGPQMRVRRCGVMTAGAVGRDLREGRIYGS